MSSIKVLNRLIEINQIHYRDHMVLVNLYLRIKNIAMAILVLRKLLMLYPNDGKSLYLLAHLYMFQGKAERTKQMLRRQKILEFQHVKYKNIKELKKSMYVLFDFDPFPYKTSKHWFLED